MKQKIIIQAQMSCDKCRSTAMKIAAVADGVSSVTIAGEGKDQVVVVGNGVDSISLTMSLRKKLRHASVLSVEEVKDKPTPTQATSTPTQATSTPSPVSWAYYPYQPPLIYKPVYEENPPNCSIV